MLWHWPVFYIKFQGNLNGVKDEGRRVYESDVWNQWTQPHVLTTVLFYHLSNETINEDFGIWSTTLYITYARIINIIGSSFISTIPWSFSGIFTQYSFQWLYDQRKLTSYLNDILVHCPISKCFICLIPWYGQYLSTTGQIPATPHPHPDTHTKFNCATFLSLWI